MPTLLFNVVMDSHREAHSCGNVSFDEMSATWDNKKVVQLANHAVAEELKKSNLLRGNVLDFGCGTGLICELVSASPSVTSCWGVGMLVTVVLLQSYSFNRPLRRND